MNDEHLEMLPNLIVMVELFAGKKLTDNQKGMLRQALQLTYHDGDRNGSERMRKIIEDVRK
jgi:hypothetical protein